MHINKAFPSSYLRAADLGDKTPTVTISDVKLEKVGEDQKLVVYFVGKDRGLVLNKTNANNIADILGSEDTDDWIDKKIRLIVAKVDYQGKRVPAIRVEVPDPLPPMRRKPEPQPEDDVDEEVGF